MDRGQQLFLIMRIQAMQQIDLKIKTIFITYPTKSQAHKELGYSKLD